MSGRVYDLHAAAVVADNGWRDRAPAPMFLDSLARLVCADCAAERDGMDPISACDAQSDVETADALGETITCDRCGIRFVDSRPRGSDIEKEQPAHVRARAAERWAAGWRGPWGSE